MCHLIKESSSLPVTLKPMSLRPAPILLFKKLASCLPQTSRTAGTRFDAEVSMMKVLFGCVTAAFINQKLAQHTFPGASLQRTVILDGW